VRLYLWLAPLGMESVTFPFLSAQRESYCACVISDCSWNDGIKETNHSGQVRSPAYEQYEQLSVIRPCLHFDICKSHFSLLGKRFYVHKMLTFRILPPGIKQSRFRNCLTFQASLAEPNTFWQVECPWWRKTNKFRSPSKLLHWERQAARVGKNRKSNNKILCIFPRDASPPVHSFFFHNSVS